MKKCAICNNDNPKSLLLGRLICRTCYREDYITATAVAERFGYSEYTVRNFMTSRDYGSVPKNDTAIMDIRGNHKTLWKSESIELFLKGIAPLNIDKVRQLNDSGVMRSEMAKILNIDKKHLNLFCRRNKIKSIAYLKCRKSPEALEDYSLFYKADVILNAIVKERCNNPLTL